MAAFTQHVVLVLCFWQSSVHPPLSSGVSVQVRPWWGCGEGRGSPGWSCPLQDTQLSPCLPLPAQTVPPQLGCPKQGRSVRDGLGTWRA